MDSAIYAELRLDGWTPEEWAVTLADPKFINPTIPGVAAYTASIDAALTLVDEGLLLETERAPNGDWRVWITPNEDEQWFGASKSPAIAIVIAALRARASA